MRSFKANIFLLLVVSLISITGFGQLHNAHKEDHVEVSLRMIGHELLLSAEDSTSRVLPIIWKDSIYGIEFESSFVLNTDKLTSIVKRIAAKNKLAKKYIVEVQTKDSNQVVYSFESNEQVESDIIPCRGRNYPEQHYRILFKIFEPFPIQKSIAKESKAPMYPWIILIVVFIGLVLFFIKMKKGKLKSNDLSNYIQLGLYQFNPISGVLLFKGEESQLTHKESDLLNLLYKSSNQTIERDVILHEVWGDEGDYVGRTLDVFISKLRKKLEEDDTIQISNVRGVGYKLILED